MRPVKARGEKFGKSKWTTTRWIALVQEKVPWGSNAAWPHFRRTTGISSGHSPAGRAIFGRSSVISRWCAFSTLRSKYLVAPQKLPRRYVWTLCEQALAIWFGDTCPTIWLHWPWQVRLPLTCFHPHSWYSRMISSGFSPPPCLLWVWCYTPKKPERRCRAPGALHSVYSHNSRWCRFLDFLQQHWQCSRAYPPPSHWGVVRGTVVRGTQYLIIDK